LVALLASTPPVHAQAVPAAAVCSDQARQGLSNVGAWAAAQCASDQPLAFAPLSLQRCTSQALEGLRRVGGWAEVQCAVGEQLGSK
jgi:hypothetical protein